jgi:hypothetical protein
MKLIKDILSELINDRRRLLTCGGVGGHMAHPFDFVSNGTELIDVFLKSVDSLQSKPGSVKIDGVNASIRIMNGKFVLDRGSANPLDIQGVRPEDLEARFGQNHGFLRIGKQVIQIFDESISTSTPELQKLGLLNNPNILLNIEYVEGQTNVVGYEKIGNFLAIHGLKEIKPKTIKDGKVTARIAMDIGYDKPTMQSYVNKLNTIALKRGFTVLGSVDTTFKSKPNIRAILDQNVTLYPDGQPLSRSLSDWLKNTKIETPLVSKKIFQQVIKSRNISSDFPDDDLKKLVDDTITYIATMKMGDEVLRNFTSKIGDLSDHEGIVVRDSAIYSEPFKITGGFIVRGQQSSFQNNQFL